MKAKLKASAIHFSISLFIFIFILYFIVFRWYPGVFFTAEGGLNGLKLMAAVDLVLGPSMTFIIYNHLKPKKEIVMDLSIIAIVQLSALVWGGLQVYSERPVALVFWEDTFYTVTEDYYKEQKIDLSEVARFSNERPLIIYAESKHSTAGLEQMQENIDKKIPPYAQVFLYKDIKSNMDKVLPFSVDVSLYRETENMVGQQHQADQGVRAILGKGKYKNFIVYLSRAGELVEIVLAG